MKGPKTRVGRVSETTSEASLSNLIPALNVRSPYSSRMSARSALYTDLRLLLDGREDALTAAEYRTSVIVDNCLSRQSIASRQKAWAELRKRYPLDKHSPLFNAFWKEWRSCSSEQEQALTAYILLALYDLLVAELGIEWLSPYLRRAPLELRVDDLRAFIAQKGRSNHPEVSEWTESTRHKIAKHFLASARDFGLACGTTKKISIHPALYGAPVRLIIRALRLARVSDLDILNSSIFRLIALEGAEVVDALGELNQRGELRFRMQADVVELEVGGAA